MFNFLKPKISLQQFIRLTMAQLIPGYENIASEADWEFQALSEHEKEIVNENFKLFRIISIYAFLLKKVDNGEIRLATAGVLRSVLELALPFALKDVVESGRISDGEADKFWAELPKSLDLFTDIFENRDKKSPKGELEFLLCQRFSDINFNLEVLDITNEKNRHMNFVCFRLASGWWKVANALLQEHCRQYRLVAPSSADPLEIISGFD